MFKELTPQEWAEEIRRGLKFRHEYGLENHWSELEALFYNVHKSQMNSGPNLIKSTGDALLATLNVPNPYLMVKPRRAEFIQAAKLTETVDNSLVKTMKMADEVESAVLHAYLWGVGILKIGYDSEFGFDPRFDVGGTKNMSGMTISQYDTKGNKIEFGLVKPGMPWVQACLPHDIVVPWGTKNIQTAMWVAHRVIRHIDDIKADPKYSNKRDLQPQMSMADFVKSYQSSMKPYRMGTTLVRQGEDEGDQEFVELWEIHDRRTGKVYVITSNSLQDEKFLRNENDLLQLNGLPFVAVAFTPRARNFWTTPDSFYLREDQAELADITIQNTKLRRAMVLKWLFDEDSIDETELVKLLSADVGSAVKVKSGHDPRASVVPLTAPPNYELASQAEQVRRNAREQIGFSRNQFGEYEQSGRRTATEVSAVQGAADLRMSRREKLLADFYTLTFEKLHPICWNFWMAPRLAEIVGPSGVPQWMQFTGQHLQGDFEVSVGFSEDNSNTLQQRRQNAVMAFSQLSQSPLVDPVALAQYLANAYNDPAFSAVFKPGVLEYQGAQQTPPGQMNLMMAAGQQPGAPSMDQQGVPPTPPQGAQPNAPVPVPMPQVQPQSRPAKKGGGSKPY